MKFLSLVFGIMFLIGGCGTLQKSDCSNCDHTMATTSCECEDCQCEDCQCPSCDHEEVSAKATVTPWELPQMNAEGKPLYKSSDFTNGIFVIEAYFLSCPYCNDNAPKVNQLAEDYKNMVQVQVLDVGIDRNDSQYDTWISRHKPNHPVLKDSSRVLINQLGTRGYPSAYIVDCNMNVVFSASGVWSVTKIAEMKAKIDDLIKNPCYHLPTL